jgi:hypothetical protein
LFPADSRRKGRDGADKEVSSTWQGGLPLQLLTLSSKLLPTDFWCQVSLADILQLKVCGKQAHHSPAR